MNKELLTPNDMIGAIHVMSGPLNFRKMINIPFEMRNQQPCFSISIREEYKVAWDRFFLTAIPYSENMYLPQTGGVASTPAVAASAPVATEVDVNDAQSIIDAISAAPVDTSNFDSENFDVKQATEEVNNMSEEGMKAFAALDWDAIFGSDDEEEEEEAEAPAKTPEPTIVPAPAPEPEPKEVTGVDALLNL